MNERIGFIIGDILRPLPASTRHSNVIPNVCGCDWHDNGKCRTEFQWRMHKFGSGIGICRWYFDGCKMRASWWVLSTYEWHWTENKLHINFTFDKEEIILDFLLHEKNDASTQAYVCWKLHILANICTATQTIPGNISIVSVEILVWMSGNPLFNQSSQGGKLVQIHWIYNCKLTCTPCKKFIESTRSSLKAQERRCYNQRKRTGILIGSFWIDKCCANESSELSYYIYKPGQWKTFQRILEPYNMYIGTVTNKTFLIHLEGLICFQSQSGPIYFHQLQRVRKALYWRSCEVHLWESIC